MLWVGGHIIVSGLDQLGWHTPHDIIHHATHAVHHLGGFAEWLVDTFCSLIVGSIVGAVIVGVMHLLPFRKKH